MADRRDPVQEAAEPSIDLYDVSTWEERTTIDGLAVALYRLLTFVTRAVVILTAVLLLIGIGGLAAITDPVISALTLLSALPAFGLAAYVWYSDTTQSEPLSLLVATFLLGVLTANFAAIVNGVFQRILPLDALGLIGMPLFFYLIVGPVEETVKLLAVRLYAYRSDRFAAVVDGAVYGAMAGLGFAVIENALYIAQGIGNSPVDLGLGIIGAGGGITAVRALAGPGHVIYSAVAGYYLGLAKFNRENRGPIIVKGLLIAAFIHATYNSTVSVGAGIINAVTGIPPIWAFLVYVIIYDGIWGLFLLRKLQRYRRAYRSAHTDEPSDPTGDPTLHSESTEFE